MNAENYKEDANFVSIMAMPLVSLLNTKANEYILDIGCGEGTLA